MRQFLLGILATVVGGAILFIVTDWYTEWTNPNQYEVIFESHPAAAFFGIEELRASASYLEKEQATSGKVGIIRIENSSDQDIRNAKFIIAPTETSFSTDNLHGFGHASFINGDMPEPQFQLITDGIEVKFPVLEAGNGSYTWIMHEPPQGFKVFSDDDNTRVEESLSFTETDSGMDFVFVFAIAITVFVLGAWLSDKLNKHMLIKAGYDPKTISAAYYRNLALEEESKGTDKGSQNDPAE